MKKQDIGMVGLGVMGRNLALNIESRGYEVAVYNYLYKDTENFLIKEANNKNIKGTKTLEEFVNSLKKPRRIMLMVKAGAPTDDTIKALKPYLEQGDIVIDGGNTLYEDTERRNKELSAAGLHFIGTGVSGGEEGALTGPSLMPGGHKDAYELVKPIFEAIAARAEDNTPCVTYIGPGGAGHFVKMVHNSIEYGDMQLIAEAYFILKHLLNLSVSDFHKTFTAWNQGELNSYLVKITADIFTKIDDDTNEPLIDKILDSAAQKGTGKWTSKNALDLGVPLPLITESVFARFISSLKSERLTASKILTGPAKINYSNDKETIIETVRKALYMSKITSYAQGFAQLRAASMTYNWDLDYGDIARIWRGGCIIRARFLEKITEAFDHNPELDNLMLDSYFSQILTSYQEALREVTMLAIKHGIAAPAFSSAIAYYDSYRTERLPANLIQAQRDYFGAHTFKRIDKEGDFHAQWY